MISKTLSRRTLACCLLGLALLAMPSMTLIAEESQGGTAPENDDFDERTAIPSPPYTHYQSTGGATKEPGEPEPCGDVEATVWLELTVDEGASLAVDTFWSGFNTILAVYTGDRLDDLQVVDCNIDTGDSYLSQVRFKAEVGITYHLQVGGLENDQSWGESGALVLNVTTYTPSTNDDFIDRSEIPTFPYTNEQTTRDATMEQDEPQPCGNIEATVWYDITTTEPMFIILDTFGSSFDTVLAVHTGDQLADLEPVECNDDAGGFVLQSILAFTADPGTAYRIQVGGYGGEVGDLVLNAEAHLLPENDAREDAIVIEGLPYRNEQTTWGATTEEGEPSPCGNIASTVWFRYTPETVQYMRVGTSGSDYDTVLAAYIEVDGTLLELDCNDDSGVGFQSRIEFLAIPGVTVYIQAGGYYGSMGTLVLNATRIL